MKVSEFERPKGLVEAGIGRDRRKNLALRGSREIPEQTVEERGVRR